MYFNLCDHLNGYLFIISFVTSLYFTIYIYLSVNMKSVTAKCILVCVTNEISIIIYIAELCSMFHVIPH